MKATNNLPKQSEIEEFLGREFFPKYDKPVSLAELVDLIQLEFQITDADRALPVPNGHGCTFNGGTILECLVHFATVRLQEKKCLVRTDKNTFAWGGHRYIGVVNSREYNMVVFNMQGLRDICHMDKDTAMIHLAGKWDDDVIEKAAQKVYETTSHHNTNL